jgi:hypothetical protein
MLFFGFFGKGEKRTSAAKAALKLRSYGTAEAVPLSKTKK